MMVYAQLFPRQACPYYDIATASPCGAGPNDILGGRMQFTPNEGQMWEKVPKTRRTALSDQEISDKYDAKSERIVTETNREKLQNFYEALKRPGYMDTRPFYQRRQRW